MASKNITVTQIRMCEDMISEDFGPLVRQLSAAHNKMRAEVSDEVKEEWGLIPLQAKEAALRAQLEDVEEKIKSLTGTGRIDGQYRSISKFDEEVTRRLDTRDLTLQKVLQAKKDLLRKVRLASVPSELGPMLNSLPETISDLLLSLPEETKKEIEDDSAHSLITGSQFL